MKAEIHKNTISGEFLIHKLCKILIYTICAIYFTQSVQIFYAYCVKKKSFTNCVHFFTVYCSKLHGPSFELFKDKYKAQRLILYKK